MPRAFPSKNGWDDPFFEGKALGTRLAAGRTVAILTLTSLTDISVLTRSALVFVTKDSFVFLDTDFDNKINAFKQ